MAEFAPHRESEPDRLPDESRTAYRDRTIPGYREKRKARQRLNRQAANLSEEGKGKRRSHNYERRQRRKAEKKELVADE